MRKRENWRDGSGVEVMQFNWREGMHEQAFQVHHHTFTSREKRDAADLTWAQDSLILWARPGEFIIRKWDSGQGTITANMHGQWLIMIGCGHLPETVLDVGVGKKLHEILGGEMFAVGSNVGDREVWTIRNIKHEEGSGPGAQYRLPSVEIRVRGPNIKAEDFGVPVARVTKWENPVKVRRNA